MNTYVLYKYRAPGSSREVDMKNETIPYEPDKALYLIHRVGETFPLWPDYPEEYGHQPKESRVLEWRLDTTRENRVVIIDTDPDDDG